MNSRKICGILIACAVLAAFHPAVYARPNGSGQTIKHDAKAADKSIGNDARDLGHATKRIATSIGHSAKEAGVGIGHGAKKAGLGIGHGAREGWDATKQAVKQVFNKND